MEYHFRGECLLVLDHKEGESRSKHVETKFNLSLSPNLDPTQYFGEDGLVKGEGIKALTNVFIQGLVGNIHLGHKNGSWNDVEHLNYIIEQLGKGFAEIGEVGEGTF